jgi:dipeptidyl aminopeptidase/acylaminoacyl peptidase
MERSSRGRAGMWLGVAGLVVSTVLLAALPGAAAGLGFEQLAALRSVREVAISADGATIAYALEVPRRPGVDPDGPAWRELRVVRVTDGLDRVYVGGDVKVSGVRFTPAGDLITYIAKREGDEHASLWAIPVAGGESRRLLAFGSAITDYRVSPDGGTLAFVAAEPEGEAREKRQEAGYTEEVFEEDWRPTRAWLVPMPAFTPPPADPSVPDREPEEPRALPIEGSISHVRFSPDGALLAVDVAPTPLVDDEYMHRRVHVVEAATGEVRARLDNPGKLGDFEFSPDGAHLAMISAADPNDPAAGRLLVAPSSGGALREVLPELEGDTAAFAWQDAATLMFVADVREETSLGEVDIATLVKKTHAVSGPHADGARVPIMTGLHLAADGGLAAIVGETPEHPAEVFAIAHGDAAPRRLTDSNPWLASVDLAPQEVFRHQARDGLELGGVLVRPLGPKAGPAPLLLMVHGGPEAHRRNGWSTSYSAPAPLAAARGYAVFFPNYRGSTGRGVAFSKLGQGDAAGAEFDDLVDAVDALVEAGIADVDRVGITGGSYGGYATAWGATRYSERFKAGVMFVGISNKISKGMTTEIPVEDIMVHTLFPPYTRWQYSLERSPIYYVEQARTPLLIAGGTADSRVHPSQSLQLYRALKLIGKTPVRYVRYPGEGHGNARAAARDDYARRLMRWMDHFVKEGRTELPPWELESGIPPDEPSDEPGGSSGNG